MRRALLIVSGVVVVAFVVALAIALVPSRTVRLAATDEPQEQLIERGRYLALLGDCAFCHTAAGGRPYAGGLALASPIGIIYSSNITPDARSGIGTYSLDDFNRALRFGIARSGHTLYPAMPYPSFARIADDDVRALYAYLMRAVAPVSQSNRANAIPWPVSLRWPLALWRKLFAPTPDAAHFSVPRYGDARIARGAYLVQGIGHCGSCHTPRALTQRELALDESGVAYLSGGGPIDGWFAVNLRGNAADGLGAWSEADILATLRGARNATSAVIGAPMGEVVVHSTQYFRDDDLAAVAAYLKTLSPVSDDRASFRDDPATAQSLRIGRNGSRGAELYVDNCAACHRSDGKGSERVFPRIAGNSTVLAANPVSVVRVILAGSRLPATAAAPSELGMPGFAWRLTDDEVAQLATFIRQSWGNRASAVSATEVRDVRHQIEREVANR